MGFCNVKLEIMAVQMLYKSCMCKQVTCLVIFAAHKLLLLNEQRLCNLNLQFFMAAHLPSVQYNLHI